MTKYTKQVSILGVQIILQLDQGINQLYHTTYHKGLSK